MNKERARVDSNVPMMLFIFGADVLVVFAFIFMFILSLRDWDLLSNGTRVHAVQDIEERI